MQAQVALAYDQYNVFDTGTPVYSLPTHKWAKTDHGIEFENLIAGIHKKFEAGEKVYIKVLAGDYKGSIFYIKEVTYVRYGYDSFDGALDYSTSLSVRPKWTGKSNSPEVDLVTIGKAKFAYLPNYTGETVFKKLNKDVEAQKIAKKHGPARDRNAKALAVGDKVTYINARYGSGMRLDFGTVKGIKFGKFARTNSKVLVTVIGADGELSKIHSPADFIIKG